MKKFIIMTFILATATFTSCIDDRNKVVDTRNDQPAQIADGYIHKIVRFGYNGHDYIMFTHLQGTASTGGVVHDPDCHCYEKEK